MNPAFLIKRSDNSYVITYSLVDDNSAVINLTNATVQFNAGNDTQIVVSKPAVITNALSGEVSVTLLAADTLFSGLYNAEFVVTFQDGTVLSYPRSGYISLNIQRNVDPTQLSMLPDGTSPLEVLNARGGYPDLNSRLNVIYNGASPLEVVNARNGYTDLNSRLGNTDTLLEEKANQSDFTMPKKNLGIAINLVAANYSSDYNLALEESRALQVKGVNGHVEACIYVTIDKNNVNTTTFNVPDITNLITPFMQYCQTNGIKISLFKIHLCTEGDSTTHLPIGSGSQNTGNIAPASGQESIWFANYESVLRQLIPVSLQYGCTHITINNENQFLTTNLNYVSYYQTMINNLKTSYPTALLGISFMDYEQRWLIYQKTHLRATVADYLDFIAFNMYPHMDDNTVYNGTLPEMRARTLIKLDINNLPRIYRLFPDKELYVSECGSMGRSNSLFMPIDTGYSQPKNNTVQQIYIQHALNEIASKDYIKGFYLWHAADPFTVFGVGCETIISSFYARWNNL